MAIHIGIDVGSVSVKSALFSSDPLDSLVFDRLDREGFSSIRQLSVDGRPCWLAIAPVLRLVRNPLAQSQALLERLISLIDRRSLGELAGTGRGVQSLPTALGVRPQHEFWALRKAVELLLPGVHTVFEIGGENSKYLRFERRGGDRQLGIADYHANGECAAGTGVFLDQQAARLRFRVEDVGQLVLTAGRTAQIAGRCSVFAKSDMIHAQQRGFTPGEIMKGLCEAVARNFQNSVIRGRKIVPEVALLGGVAANAGVVRALENCLGWETGTLRTPANAASFGAVGAALLAHASAGADARRGPEPSLGLVSRGPCSVPSAPRLSMEHVLSLRDCLQVVPLEDTGHRVDAFLGIDIGSVSTNLVVIDAACRVLQEVYLRTDARPIEAVGCGLRQIQHRLGGRIRVCGVGTTGSGRELIGELVGADSVLDEITAHKTGSAHVDRTILGLGVDTILEIGGQDAKYIRIEKGIVVDFAMNEACAAGTGSFLEERAHELGIKIDQEFARLALSSESPLRLGERCTVFMERDVNAYLQRGAPLEDIVAGLAYSVASNYINRVVQGRKIGDVVFFQGGTAYNDAVAAALGSILDCRVIVPPFNGVMGALGMALLAREYMQMPGLASSRFRGFSLDAVDCETFEFSCHGCCNYCQMQRITVQGEHSYWGDRCSVRYRKTQRFDRSPVVEDVIERRNEMLLADYDPVADRGPTIGLPFCMSMRDWAPFWFAVFRELNVRVQLSEPTTTRTVRSGLEATVSEPCFPVQVAHGHVRWLLEQGVDFVLVPNMISAVTEPGSRPSFFCPWNQTLPFVARSSPYIAEDRHRIVAPTLWFDRGVASVATALKEAFAAVGLRWNRSRVDRAVRQGLDALATFRCAVVDLGRRAVSALEASGDHGVLLLGRPYNLYDNGVNLDLPSKLRRYYGANVIGFDFLDLDSDGIEGSDEHMFWNSGARLLAAARFARTRPFLHLIYVTNFKCGPDSFIKHYIAEASDRPFLSLQFDGHNNDAGMLTRCEAYLESKGALDRRRLARLEEEHDYPPFP